MKEDDLLQKLLDRLYEVSWPHCPVSWSAHDAADQRQTMYEPIARECLRQMEWAARTSYEDGRSNGRMAPLTLAPDDWQA